MGLVRYLSYVSLAVSVAACGGGGGSTTHASSVQVMSSSAAVSSVASSSVSSSSVVSSGSESSISSSMSSSSSETGLSFTLTSSNFNEGATLPSKITCDGLNVSPALTWTGAPESTQSFAIIVDDPDAVSVVGYTWVHWNISNLPSTTTSLTEGASGTSNLPSGAAEGASDFGSVKYGGPCPPSGRHRYYFVLYALNKTSVIFSGATTRSEFEAAHNADIIQKTTLTGYFR